MIPVPKFQFKSKSKIKSPVSTKNRMIKLGIDATTGVLIVAMFFFARHLRLMMPGPPPKPIKFSALADALNSKASSATSNVAGLLAQTTPATVSSANTSSISSTSAPAVSIADGNPTTPSPSMSDAATAPAPASGAPLAMQVEVPGSSHTAEQNMGGWLSSPKSDKTPAAANLSIQGSTKADDGNMGRAMMAAMSAPAKVETSQPQVQPAPAPAAPVSLGDSLMAVISPSAKAETIQPEMQPMKSAVRPMAAPAARQALRVSAPVHHDPVPLTDEQQRLLVAQTRFENVMEMAIGNPDVFGFAPGEHLDEAMLGTPIAVYTIMPSDRKGYQLGQPIRQLLQTTNEWVYPVILKKRVRFMVPVKRVDGEYVSDTSSRALAMVYEKIRQRWPTSEGYHPELVLHPTIGTYYFTIPELPDQNLTDTSVMFQFKPTLSPASVILASWSD